MQLNVPRDKQIEKLKELLADCEVQIYQDSLVVGVEPETVNYDWAPPEGMLSNPNHVASLQRELARHKSLSERLAALE